jgi:hypothetical protein
MNDKFKVVGLCQFKNIKELAEEIKKIKNSVFLFFFKGEDDKIERMRVDYNLSSEKIVCREIDKELSLYDQIEGCRQKLEKETKQKIQFIY